MPQPARLALLHSLMRELIVRVTPVSAAVEELFFASNTTTAMQVAEARGVILLALEQGGVPIWQYTPMQVKASLTGYGKAGKPQMVRMVRAVTGAKDKLPDDAFDAVAVALCHIASQRLQPDRKIS
jgi:crossover junction endodeoxyribonuclease RuvC